MPAPAPDDAIKSATDILIEAMELLRDASGVKILVIVDGYGDNESKISLLSNMDFMHILGVLEFSRVLEHGKIKMVADD